MLCGCQDLLEIFIAKKGSLVAAPGMSFEQVRKGSTLPLPKEYRMSDETTLTNSDIVEFEFKLAGTEFSASGCKFYSLWEKNAAPGLYHVQIQVDKNLTWASAKQRFLEIQGRLKSQGWRAVGMGEPRLDSAPGYSVGSTWLWKDISLNLTARRFPYAINQEDPNEGAHYEIELDIRPNNSR
jgi:hypothetical protein